jgi:cytochrome c2
MYPMAKVVKGYNPVMNSFKGLLDEDEVSSIIAYMKTLK